MSGSGVFCYGTLLVAVVTLVVSIFTAKRRYGVLMALIGLALLIIAAVVLSVTFG